jgi:hypothetical protein
VTLEKKLFYFSLKYKQAQQIDDILNQKKWFNKIVKLNITQQLHPIPTGRAIGIQISNLPTDELDTTAKIYNLIEVFGFNQGYNKAISFMLYLCRELFYGKKINWLKYVLFEFEKFHGNWVLYNRTEEHLGIKIENQLRIYVSFAYILDGNNKKAKKCFDSIDPNLFESFFYKQIFYDYMKVQNELKYSNSNK